MRAIFACQVTSSVLIPKLCTPSFKFIRKYLISKYKYVKYEKAKYIERYNPSRGGTRKPFGCQELIQYAVGQTQDSTTSPSKSTTVPPLSTSDIQ